MKKVIKTIVLLLLLTFLITGCSMRANVGLVVSKDKTVTVKIISAMDDEMIDYYLSMQEEDGSAEEKTYTDDERWEYIEKSNADNKTYAEYTKEKYDQDGYKGYVFTLELGNIDDLSTTDPNAKSDFNALNKESKIFIKDGNKYTLNINSSSEDVEEAKSYQEYGATFDIKFYITLPNKAISNNATTVSDDGLTYTWDLLQAQDIQLEFNINKTNTTLIICIVAAVILIGIIIAIFATKSGSKESSPTVNDTPADEPIVESKEEVTDDPIVESDADSEEDEDKE